MSSSQPAVWTNPTEACLHLIRRFVDDSTLLSRLAPHLKENSLTLDDESDGAQAIQYILKTTLEAHKAHRDNLHMGVLAQRLSNVRNQTNISDEIKGRILYYRNLLEGSGLREEKEKNIAKKILAYSKDDAVLNEIFQRLRLYSFYKWHNSSLKPAIQSGDINAAQALMHKQLEQMNDLQIFTSRPFDFKELHKLLSEYGESVDLTHAYYKTGMKVVDDELCGGYYRKTLNGFMAISGGGKSQMCTHIAAECVRQKLRCHVAIVEEEDRLFGARLVAAVSGIPTNDVLKYLKLSDSDKKKYADAVELIEKYVILDPMYGKSIEEVHQIKKERITDIQRKNLWAAEHPEENLPSQQEIVVDILDYSGHIATTGKGDKGWEKMRDAYAARKNFVLMNNLIGFDFIQVNREGTKKGKGDVLNRTDIAGGFDIIQLFDNFCSINRSDQQSLDSVATIYIDKARSGNLKGKKFNVKTEFNKGRYDFSSAEEITGVVNVGNAPKDAW